MSVVSGVTLQISCSEGADEGQFPLVEKINRWLADQNLKFEPLRSVEDHYGGPKHPQVHVYGGGYYSFPEDDFAALVVGLPWNEPERCVLLINPDAGPTKIFRPAET